MKKKYQKNMENNHSFCRVKQMFVLKRQVVQAVECLLKKHLLVPVVRLAVSHMEGHTADLNQNDFTNFVYNLCVDSGREALFTCSYAVLKAMEII